MENGLDVTLTTTLCAMLLDLLPGVMSGLDELIDLRNRTAFARIGKRPNQLAQCITGGCWKFVNLVRMPDKARRGFRDFKDAGRLESSSARPRTRCAAVANHPHPVQLRAQILWRGIIIGLFRPRPRALMPE